LKSARAWPQHGWTRGFGRRNVGGDDFQESSHMSAEPIHDRIRRSFDRFDTVNAAIARRISDQYRADAADREAEQAEREQARRDRLRRWADRCDQHQRRYDAVFEGFGRRAPEPAADAHPPSYRRDLFRIGQSMLPSGHDWAKGDPDDIGPSAIAAMEEQLLQALREQAERPTGDNVPQTVDDPRAKREVFDDSLGRKVTVYKARRSFIHDFTRPAVRAIIHNPHIDQSFQLLRSARRQVQF
jgi:hypothetical protein